MYRPVFRGILVSRAATSFKSSSTHQARLVVRRPPSLSRNGMSTGSVMMDRSVKDGMRSIVIPPLGTRSQVVGDAIKRHGECEFWAGRLKDTDGARSKDGVLVSGASSLTLPGGSQLTTREKV